METKHGAPNFNISKSKDKLIKNYIDELLKNKFIKIDDSELIFLGDETKKESIKNLNFIVVIVISLYFLYELSQKIIEYNDLRGKFDLFLKL